MELARPDTRSDIIADVPGSSWYTTPSSSSILARSRSINSTGVGFWRLRPPIRKLSAPQINTKSYQTNEHIENRARIHNYDARQATWISSYLFLTCPMLRSNTRSKVTLLTILLKLKQCPSK